MRQTSDELIQQIKEKQSLYSYKSETLEKLKTSQANLQEKLKAYKEDLEEANNMILACKLLLEKLVNSNKASLENFLTFALKKIFTDRNYSIKLNLKEDSKRPGLDLVLVENDIEQNLSDSVGGGILSTLGLLLQIYYIEAFKLSRVMFIDEGLKEISKADPSNLSKDYLSGILDFLKWLSEEKNYIFVVVTHDQDVVSKSDIVYRVSNGEVIKQSERKTFMYGTD